MTCALTVAATEASLARIRTWLDQTVGAGVADAGIQARLLLAVHEIAANVIEHAYAGAAGQHLSVTIDINPARVTARIDHAGTPFDPTTLTPPVFDGTRSRGFGLWLASRACSDVSFTSDGANRHSVLLTIYLTNKAAS